MLRLLPKYQFGNNVVRAAAKAAWAPVRKAQYKAAWDYINGPDGQGSGTFMSDSLGKVTWGYNKYKQVCSTGSWAALHKMGIADKPYGEVDNDGSRLKSLGFVPYKVVDAKNYRNQGYIPQDGDTAVWPTSNKYIKGRNVQHQATYLNGHWISDTIQRDMGVYGNGDESQVHIYRYNKKY